MTVAQAAEKIGISASKLYELVACRRISHYRIGGKILMSDEDISAYLETCRVGAVTPVESVPPRARPALKHLKLRT